MNSGHSSQCNTWRKHGHNL